MAQGPPSEMFCTFGNEQGYPYPWDTNQVLTRWQNFTDPDIYRYFYSFGASTSHAWSARRAACAATTATEFHEKEQTTGLHVQASVGTHTNMTAAHQIGRRLIISRLRRHVSSRLRLVEGTTEEKRLGAGCVSIMCLFMYMSLLLQRHAGKHGKIDISKAVTTLRKAHARRVQF